MPYNKACAASQEGVSDLCHGTKASECTREEKCVRLLQVGFGKDFQASRNIDNDVGRNFHLLGSFLTEAVKRNGDPLRQFSRSQVRFHTFV
jgi:hypothetical protein